MQDPRFVLLEPVPIVRFIYYDFTTEEWLFR